MTYDRYVLLKESNQDRIVLLKVGNFYHTFDEDSVLLHYLFQYKIKENTLGFPVRTLPKIIHRLKKENISFLVDDVETLNFENNLYFQSLEKAECYLTLENDIEDIYQYLTSNIERKYIQKIIKRIKDIINEG